MIPEGGMRMSDEELLAIRGDPAEDPARTERIRAEIASGFATLAGIGKAVSVFGSARCLPVILLGTTHWAGLAAWLEERLLHPGLIDPDDTRLLRIVDDPEEAAALAQLCHLGQVSIDGPGTRPDPTAHR